MMPFFRGRWRWLVSLLALAALIFIFRSFLLGLVIEPIAWLVWASWRLLAAVDRGLLWLGMVLVCAGLAIRIVPLSRGHDDGQDAPSRLESGASDRLAHWRALTASALQTQAGRSALLPMLRDLAKSVAEVTRRPLPAAATPRPEKPLHILLNRLLPARRARDDRRRIEDLLSWMETALEINHDS